jgi:hypothetical protein
MKYRLPPRLSAWHRHWLACLRDRRACRRNALEEFGQVLQFAQSDPEIELDWLGELTPARSTPPRRGLRMLLGGLAGVLLVILAVHGSAPLIPELARSMGDLLAAGETVPAQPAPPSMPAPLPAEETRVYPPTLPLMLVWVGPRTNTLSELDAEPSLLHPPPLAARTEPPAVEEAGRAQGVGVRLIECARHFSALRLARGQKGNALSCYREVLAEAPDNPQARAGIQAIIERYLSWIEQSMARGDRQAAQRYLAELQSVNPDLPELAGLRKRIGKAPRATSAPVPAPETARVSPAPREPAPACPHCTCSELLSRLSLGITPLSPAEQAFLRACR